MEPPDPRVGDRVTVTVYAEQKGLVRIIDSEGKVVVETGLKKISFTVNKPGEWCARFIYKDDGVRVAEKCFYVKQVETKQATEQVTKKVEEHVEIRDFESSCLLAREERVSWYQWTYLALVAPALLMIARRRVGG